MPNEFWKMIANTAGNAATGGLFGIASGAIGNMMQVGQQDRLGEQQVKYQKELTDYNRQSAMQMWRDTGYGPQVEQMKEAGINPALMYGMGGGGGQTAQVTPGSTSGGQAQNQGMGIGNMMIEMQLMNEKKDLLIAQKELAEANKLTEGQKQWELSLKNALETYWQNTDEKGEPTDHNKNSMAVKEKMLNMLVNNTKVKEAIESINLMKEQGKTQQQMQAEIANKVKLLQSEIDWNALDMNETSAGNFLLKLIQNLIKAR